MIPLHLQERMDETRVSSSEARAKMASISEQVQSFQYDLIQSEQRREKLEAELNNTREVKIYLT